MQDAYWAEQVDIQRRIALAWVAYSEGRKAEGIAELRAAADAADATDKSAVSPGPLAPARELLRVHVPRRRPRRRGAGRVRSESREEPNRFRGLYGAGQAAEAAGDRVKAARFYQQLLKMAPGDASSQRPELQHARTFVGGRS